ncbi:zinc finger protein 541-like [Patagioenas fasciata]|uniref:zinc finger protein 541-like n=2 Tax=Patagioenas fasciata TaxID=372321 RepID=UPI003A993D56
MKALEMLLSGGPPKSESDPLANYHYAGSDTWTPLEQQLFHRAFATHKKDFYRIHKKVQTKTVAQCVEYYYIWKKTTKLKSYRAKGTGKKAKRNKEKAEEKATFQPPKKKPRPSPEERAKTKQQMAQNEGAGESFPCTECGRAFATMRGKNAHMRWHRARELQAGTELTPKGLEIEDKPAEMVIAALVLEPQAGTELPIKCLKIEEKPAEMAIAGPELQVGVGGNWGLVWGGGHWGSV